MIRLEIQYIKRQLDFLKNHFNRHIVYNLKLLDELCHTKNYFY